MDDTSTSYCHYSVNTAERRLISLEDLKAGIRFAMVENLMIQFVLPNYELPADFKEVMNTIDHHLIVPARCADRNALNAADVVVANGMAELSLLTSYSPDVSYVVRTDRTHFLADYKLLDVPLCKAMRLNVVITDVEAFTGGDFTSYKQALADLGKIVEQEYVKQHTVQFNLLTDRLTLQSMNNCGAADKCVTLAPDGKLYACPACYYDGVPDGSEKTLSELCRKGYSIGDIKSGLCVANEQLYKLDHAPLCRKCDAFQCHRCIWLNRRTTLEVNTPSHEQCVMAHIERNASRDLLQAIRQHGTFLPSVDIKKISYLDPFEVKDDY